MVLDNFNIDENTVNKLKELIQNGNLNDVVSQIPPDVLKNFSSMLNNNSESNKKISDSNKSYDEQNSSNNVNFDFNNIDINTVLKIKSIMENMNTNNDSRSNLLNSLKPYLRDSRRTKIDQYSNILNFAKIAELLKNNNKENPNV